MRLERLAKGASIVFAMGLGWWLWVRASAKASLGMGEMYATLAPLLVLLILWMSASKITQRPTNFLAGMMWSVMLPLGGASSAFLGASTWSSEDGSRVIASLLFVCAAPALFFGPFAFKTTRWHRDWKARYLAERLHEPEA